MGIIEGGKYEDESVFAFSETGVERIFKKYTCSSSGCTLLQNPSNFNDDETILFDPDNNTKYQNWNTGMHGTGVASIALGINHNINLDGKQLGDPCYLEYLNLNHCATLMPRSTGMAFAQKNFH
jgi:hypothetical protein